MANSSEWRTESSEIVYETRWIKVRRDNVTNHAGKPLIYSVVELHYPSVFIVAANEDNEVLIQQNYRYTIDRTIWELPAGHSEGREILEAAKEELLVECGYESEDWTDLGQFYQAIGTANMPLHICMARDVTPTSAPRPEDGELILERRFASLAEIGQMITAGEFVNAADIGALAVANLHGL